MHWYLKIRNPEPPSGQKRTIWQRDFEAFIMFTSCNIERQLWEWPRRHNTHQFHPHPSSASTVHMPIIIISIVINRSISVAQPGIRLLLVVQLSPKGWAQTLLALIPPPPPPPFTHTHTHLPPPSPPTHTARTCTRRHTWRTRPAHTWPGALVAWICVNQ